MHYPHQKMKRGKLFCIGYLFTVIKVKTKNKKHIADCNQFRM